MASYEGTKITGTETLAKIFKKSNVKKAKVNDTYLNTTTGHVYVCTVAGKPSEAKWSYNHTNVVNKPDCKVANLTFAKRQTGTSNITAKWKVPSEATSSKNGARWSKIEATFTLKWAKKKSGKNVTDTVTYTLNTTDVSKTYNASFQNAYPTKSKSTLDDCLLSVSVSVRGKNTEGKGPAATETYSFEAPEAPKLTLSYDDATGKVTANVKASDPGGTAHRRDSVLTMKREGKGGSKTLANESSSTSTDRTVDKDIEDASTLLAGQYVKVSASAYSRGVGGNGNESSASYYIAHPNAPVCKEPTLSYVTSGVLSTASVVVAISNVGKIAADGTNIVPSTIKLQRLKDSTATTADAASAASGWNDVSGAVDSGNCTGLVDAYTNAVSGAGLRTWYRVAAIKDGYTQYGVPVYAKCIYIAAATNKPGAASISTCKSNSDGTGISVSWRHSGYTNGGGVELSWSSNSTAWSSTSPPSTHSIISNNASGTYTIGSLTSGTEYYVRVRGWCYDTDGTTVIYGSYCKDLSSALVQSETGNAKIDSIVATNDKQAAKITVHNTQASDDAVEVSWADKTYAWDSNSAPNTLLVKTSGTATKSAYITGLEPGTTYYFRVRPLDGSTYGSYSGSETFALPAVKTANEDTSEDVGNATVTAVPTGNDGTKVLATVTRQSVDDTMQVSWSTDENAWKSNSQPSILEIDWATGKTAKAYITGLEQGVTVFVRARCVRDGDSSPWSDAVAVTPYDVPESVVATVPPVVPSGSEIPVTWTFDGTSKQVGWRVNLDNAIVAQGTDARGAATISRASNGSHTVSVAVSCGSGWKSSPTVPVTVAAPPSGTLTAPSTITAQPVALTVSGMPDSSVFSARLVADGCEADDLHDAQPEGTVVWSGGWDAQPLSGTYTLTSDATVQAGKNYYIQVDNVWTMVSEPTDDDISTYYELGDPHTVTLTMPSGLDLRDGAGYTVSLTVTDTSTGLSTALPDAPMVVAWSHQAAAPSGTVAVDDAALSASITVVAPADAALTDVFDLYRVTPQGAYLIAEGREFGTAVSDPYAPFRGESEGTNLRYRAVTRTADGDMEWTDDLEYDLYLEHARFDWARLRGVELPYNLSLSNSWQKDYQQRTHLDGSIGGSWSRAVSHSAGIDGAMVKAECADDRELLEEMARFAGPVFVRTPDGMAYLADVQVTSLASNAAGALVSAGLSAKEVALTEDYMAEPVLEDTTTTTTV